jgi:endonuclease YncB( thermonuclease family)
VLLGSALADWVTVASGAATVVLAGLTVVLMLSTRRASRAAEEASRLAQRQLQESVRPLIVPQPPREHPDDPERTLLPVRNIGVAPAVNLHASVPTGRQREGVVGRVPLGKVAGVAAGETVELSFNAGSVPARKLGRVELTFTDVAGQRYVTEASWDQRGGQYSYLRVSERRGLRIEPIPPPSRVQRWRSRAASLARSLRPRAREGEQGSE